MGRGLTEGTPRPIDRASPNDLINLAVDHGPVPMNIAAVLVLENAAGISLPALRTLLADRLPRVRRLRQRLDRVPLGAGRPIWVDDPDFDLDRHVGELSLIPAPRAAGPALEDRRLLDVAADLVCRPLPRDRPLWAAWWVTGLADGAAALVLVVHHVLADGLGGLAVLGALADEGAPAPQEPVSQAEVPQRLPGWRALARDAWAERATALHGIRRGLAGSAAGLRELGMGHRPTLAPATSLNRATGSRRRLTSVDVPLDPVVRLAHSRGATVNDVVLTAIVGAMAGTLRLRGERPTEIVVSVPISSRSSATADELGNRTGVVPMSLPTSRHPDERLAQVVARSRVRRAGVRGSSAGPMGLAFRALGRVGLFQPFIARQRLVNTFVTNLRGPEQTLLLAGHRVTAVLPVAVNPGNVGVSFDVLSYAGRLVVTVVADPDVVPDQDLLTRLLSEELAHFTGVTRGAGT